MNEKILIPSILAKLDISHTAFRIAVYLHDHEADIYNQTELGEQVGMSKSTVNKAIKELVEKNIVSIDIEELHGSSFVRYNYVILPINDWTAEPNFVEHYV